MAREARGPREAPNPGDRVRLRAARSRPLARERCSLRAKRVFRARMAHSGLASARFPLSESGRNRPADEIIRNLVRHRPRPPARPNGGRASEACPMEACTARRLPPRPVVASARVRAASGFPDHLREDGFGDRPSCRFRWPNPDGIALRPNYFGSIGNIGAVRRARKRPPRRAGTPLDGKASPTSSATRNRAFRRVNRSVATGPQPAG